MALALQLGDDDLVHVEEAVAARGRCRRTRPPCRGGRCRRRPCRCCRRSSGATGGRGRPRPSFPSSRTATVCSSDLDGDQDLLLDVRERRRGLAAGFRAGGACARASAPPALLRRSQPASALGFPGAAQPLLGLGDRGVSVFFFRPRPPRLPRRRRAGFRSASAVLLPGRLLSLGRLGSGCLGGRLLPALLPAKPGHIDGLLSGARRARRRSGARRAAACLPQISCDFRAGSRLPDPGWIVRAHPPQSSSRQAVYAAAGRRPVRLRSTARRRWLRRAHAQGSTSS